MGGKNRSEKRKRRRSRRFAVILPYVLVCVMFVFAFGERWLAVAEISREIRRGEAELAAVQARKAELEAEEAQSKDPALLTIKMRELGYIYPGETVYLGAGCR